MIPAPYPSDTRAKGWRFEIDHERIRQSDTWALAPSDMRPWFLMLWMVAWEQTPCGSLPNDDALIAARIGMTPKAFAKNKELLMRGWDLADDGRLYHHVITERVLEMVERRTKDAGRKSLYDKKFQLIKERDGGACVYCGATKYLSLDHLIAVSRGGSGDERNLVCACRSCNSRKGARTPDEADMSFVNPSAERLWLAIRDGGNALPHRSNGNGTRLERGGDDTGTGTGTSTCSIPLPLVEGSGAAPSAAPPIPPPAFDGKNAEILNGKSVIALADEWELPERWGFDAEALGFTPSEVLREAERFRQYWTRGKGKGTRRSVKGWSQSWSNWLGKAGERR